MPSSARQSAAPRKDRENEPSFIRVSRIDRGDSTAPLRDLEPACVMAAVCEKMRPDEEVLP